MDVQVFEFVVAPGVSARYAFTNDDDGPGIEGDENTLAGPVGRAILDAIRRREGFPDEARRAVAARDTAGLAGAHNDAHLAVLTAPLSPGARFIGFRVFWFRPGPDPIATCPGCSRLRQARELSRAATPGPPPSPAAVLPAAPKLNRPNVTTMDENLMICVVADYLYAVFVDPEYDGAAEFSKVQHFIEDVLAKREGFPDEADRAVAAGDVAGLAEAHNAVQTAFAAAVLPAGARFVGFELQGY